MCEFAITFSSLPEGLVVGAVLNAGITKQTPNGLLVKVTAIDGNRVTAVQATLQDALIQGEFWVERAFGPDQLRGTPKLAPGVKIAPHKAAGLRRPLPGTVPAFDQLSLPGKLEIDTDPVSGVHLSGTLDFGVGCGLDGGVGGSDIAWMEIGCQAWEAASLSVEATKSTPVSEKDIFLADFPLAGIVIPIGPVIAVVIVDILVTADLTGQVHVGMKYHGYEHAEVYGGLKFSLGHGLDHDGGVKTSASGTSGVPKADLTVTALGRAELRISMYGVLGIGVGGDASITLAGGPSQNPRWRITANAGLFVEIFLGILGFKLSAWIRYHLMNDFTVNSGGNGSPELTVTWPTDGQVIRAGGLLSEGRREGCRPGGWPPARPLDRPDRQRDRSGNRPAVPPLHQAGSPRAHGVRDRLRGSIGREDRHGDGAGARPVPCPVLAAARRFGVQRARFRSVREHPPRRRRDDVREC